MSVKSEASEAGSPSSPPIRVRITPQMDTANLRPPSVPNIFTFAQSPPKKVPALAAPRQIHRNRISYSCHACRRRKVKCNRQHPICSNCTKTAELCTYDDHKDDKPTKPTTTAVGSKRRRTTDEGKDATTGWDREGGKDESLNVPIPLDISKEVDLETRMNRLAEIVDRWYRDASTQGGVPADGRPPGGEENGFAQSQAFTDLMQQSTGPIRHGSARSASVSPSPTHTLSPNVSTTPGSSIGGRQEPGAESPYTSRNSLLTLKLLTARIEATKQSGKDEEVDDLGIGHLSIQGGGRSRYVGTSFWGLLSSEVAELNEVLKTHTQFEKISNHNQTCDKALAALNNDTPGGIAPSFDISSASTSPPAASPPQPVVPPCLSTCPQTALAMFSKASFLQFEPREIEARSCEIVAMVLSILPAKPFTDVLYQSFLHGVHPVMPLLHAPTFDAQYNCFWEWYPDNQRQRPGSELTDNPTFLPLLLAVVYAGAISMSSKVISQHTETSKETLTSQLYGATMSALAGCAFPRSPTVNSLISFLIVQTCLIREEEPLTSCSFVGMAMRVAQSMGLHRDGSLFGLSEVECEVRRRVWWHIMYLDVQGAIATGLPPLGGSGEDLYDTKMVSELQDEYIGLPPGAADPITPMTPHILRCQEFYHEKLDPRASPAMILAAGRYESTLLLRAIITRLFAIRGSKKTDLMEMGKMIYELKLKLEKRIKRIPARGIPEMGFIPPPGEGGECGWKPGSAESAVLERTAIFNSWARIMLSLLSDRAFGVLYQPFLKSAKSTMWKHARNCALHFCHSFLRKFLHLSRTPLFQPYQWFCPGTYQPLHATMILLLDLHERPFTPEAPKSRGFVDEVFAVFGEHGNYSTGDGEGGNRPLMEGGREAWRMLWRLRKKAYAKAGVKIPAEQAAREQEEKGILVEEELYNSCVPGFADFPMGAPVHAEETAAAAAPPQTEPLGGGFEELLQMDTIIDAEDKAFFTEDVVVHFTQPEARPLKDIGLGMPPGFEEEQERRSTLPEQETQFDPLAGGQDMMDFDWEEWDQVFGKYVSVDVL